MKASGTASYTDISIKASCSAPQLIEQILRDAGARFAGVDNQSDNYYKVPVGKLKHRKGNIENLLTHYLREEVDGYNRTTVFIYQTDPSVDYLQQVLRGLEHAGTVCKQRSIYFIDNVKFHIDRFDNGNAFVEIEAIDREGSFGPDVIRRQAEEFKALVRIRDVDIVRNSYIDF